MTDLQDLHHAFAELERRADDHAAADLTVRPAHPVRTSYRRPVLIGATAAVLLAGVVSSVALVGGNAGPTSAPAASPSGPPASSGASTDVSTGGSTDGSRPSTVNPDPATTVPVATTVADLQNRFTAALGGLATFSVTTTNEPLPTDDPVHDVAIVGVLTTPSGVSGGYDVQTLIGQTGTAQCATDTPCRVTTLADGSSLAVGTASLLSPDGNAGSGVTYEVVVVRPDGIEVLMHVSNQRDPKGMSEQSSVEPPLTTAQMTTVVTSPAWVTG